MAEVDWDETLEDVKASPRGLLTDWLRRLEEIAQIVIVIETKAGEIEVGWSFDDTLRRSSLTVLMRQQEARD